MSVEEESETQPLVEDNPTSNSGSLDDSDAKPVTKGDPPEFSEVELQEAHKKYGRDIIFGDEVGDTGSLHRITESKKLHYSQENVALYGGEGGEVPKPKPQNGESVCCTVQ